MGTEFSANGSAPGFSTYFPTGPLSPQSPGVMNPFDAAVAKYGSEKPSGGGGGGYHPFSSLLMRKLPMSTTPDSLRSMLIFAKDCLSVDFMPQSFSEDTGYKTALARFRRPAAAEEARAMLDGRPNSNGEATMIVEVVHLTPGGNITRRSAAEPREPRPSDHGPNHNHHNGYANRPASKFNSTFQGLERVSPPRLASFNSGDSGPSYQPTFSPQSPFGHPLERQRVSGKSMIGEDGVDDDTGKLLHDPVAYAQNENLAHHHHPGNGHGHGHGGGPGMPGPTRRSTMPHIPTTHFAGLSLTSPTAGATPPGSGMTSPRTGTGGPLQSPTAFTPGTPFGGPSSAFSPALPTSPPFATGGGAGGGPPHPAFPPVNPADQNPPCNTLYVGNLPLDTAEDELKALFSKQRGYRRLCFRTKGNGPMCFVEFEDVSFATKALQALYGYPLSNSVKGGIRLSFSKNPLGVRTGPAHGVGAGAGGGGGGGMASPMGTPHSAGCLAGLNGNNGMGGGAGGGMPPGFTTANGPPPGIPAPPGLIHTGGATAGPMPGPLSAPLHGGFQSMGGGAAGGAAGAGRSPSVTSAAGAWSAAYADYLVGR